MQPFFKELLKELVGEPMDTSEWEKAVLAILVAILLLGLLTIWQVSIFASLFLVNGAIGVYILLVVLTLITWRRFQWIYPIDGLLGLGLVAATVSQPEHLAIATSGAILPTFIMIVGNILAFSLGVTSLFVSWKQFSPQILARQLKYQKVHANCAPDAPCRTIPGYRV